MGDPQNGGFQRENPIKKDDLEVIPFQESPIHGDLWRMRIKLIKFEPPI